jgi:protein-S-isoprenylcysteine O-methyltransferase Ste14
MLALAAHYVWYPAFVIRGIPYVALVIVGLALVAIGVPIWVAASTAVDQAFAAGHLATQGVYALCRNPIYGNAIIFTIPGILLFFRSWLLLTVPLAMVLAFRLLNMDTAIQRESIRKLARPENVVLLCTAHTGCTADYADAMRYWHDERHVERCG